MAIDAARVQIRPGRLGDADALHRLVQQSHAFHYTLTAGNLT